MDEQAMQLSLYYSYCETKVARHIGLKLHYDHLYTE